VQGGTCGGVTNAEVRSQRRHEQGGGAVTLFCGTSSSGAHRRRLAAVALLVAALRRPVKARSCTERLGERLGSPTTKKIRAESKGGGVRQLHHSWATETIEASATAKKMEEGGRRSL
jgi:hypothetical protein